MSSCSTGELRQTCVHDLQLLKTARVEKGHLIFDLETLLFPLSFNKHAARVQISTVIYSHIAPFFHIYIYLKFVRTLLLACTNVKLKRHVSLEHKSSVKSLGYIYSNRQKYTVWGKIFDFSFMPKIIRILKSCCMKIFSKFPTVNISKLNF